ncbi:hypothetical protein A6R68_16385 [Neotoma lepida]|uniref:Uncharacterized protein n=1 Tax=Neotoma lepida TaxID=56216 RepID=A0A1A6HF00_NEOLE|nr:hypothetical protein A6R68_16385 [Neotoma lepida]
MNIPQEMFQQSKTLKLLGYHTSQCGYVMTFISKYVSPMETQKSIYYITTESKAWVDNSAFIEHMKKWGIEVVYITKPIYRCCMQQVKELYGEKPSIFDQRGHGATRG